MHCDWDESIKVIAQGIYSLSCKIPYRQIPRSPEAKRSAITNMVFAMKCGKCITADTPIKFQGDQKTLS